MVVYPYLGKKVEIIKKHKKKESICDAPKVANTKDIRGIDESVFVEFTHFLEPELKD